MASTVTLAEYAAALAAVKTTDSGLVEWANNSLQDVEENYEYVLHKERGLMQVTDTTELQTLGQDDTNQAVVVDVGYFLWKATGTPNGTTIFAAAGGGVWKLQAATVNVPIALTDLTDTNISMPANGQVLRYNSSNSKWENGTPTVSSIDWANVTNTPTTLAGYGITNNVLQLAAGSGSVANNTIMTGSLPVATTASRNVVVGILPAFTTGSTNIVVAPTATGLPDFKTGSNSVVVTPRTSLHAATVGTQAVSNSVVIGDCGALDDIYISDSLTNVLVLGTNGEQVLTKTNDGKLHLLYDVATSSNPQTIIVNGDTGVVGNLSVSAALTVGSASTTAALTVGGDLGVQGNTTLGNATTDTVTCTGPVTMNKTLAVTESVTIGTTLGVTTNATIGGTLGVTGAATFSSTAAFTGAVTGSSSATFVGGLTGGNIKSGAGPAWILGAVTVGGVSLDTANYVAVTIGGVPLKLGIVT